MLPRYLAHRSSILGLLAFCLYPCSAVLRAEVTMPQIFGDHMVLQQGTEIPVWGWASPGELITVALGGETASAKAGEDGRWMATLPPVFRRNEPLSLAISASNEVVFEDVVVGDVWVCSGQSNMEFGLGASTGGKEAIDTANFPQIRMFAVPNSMALTPQEKIIPAREDARIPKWYVCSPENLIKNGWGSFTAVGFYFGREIHKTTGNPVGLIASHWGGTPAEAWLSLDGIQKEEKLENFVADYRRREQIYPKEAATYPARYAQFKTDLAKWEVEVNEPLKVAMQQWEEAAKQARSTGAAPPPRPTPSRPLPQPPERPEGGTHVPANLFNGMIAPLIPYAIKGVIWYQGESNVGRARSYSVLFPRLIADWREKWGQGEFPFLFVQLANYRSPAQQPVEGEIPALREAQLKTLRLPNTGMAVAIDLGEEDIHPKNKLDVGLRLAAAARHVAYGQDLVYSGPIYDSAKIEGSRVTIAFKQTGSGLQAGKVPDINEELKGFAIAGEDRKWVWAKASFQGNRIVVSSPEVPKPVAVRYAWADNPLCNLYNKEGFPASPFRTDDWPVK